MNPSRSAPTRSRLSSQRSNTPSLESPPATAGSFRLRTHAMSEQAAELARRLAREAEAVCRHFLSNGRREGRYWLVGDARNTRGRSMFVRLKGPESGRGAAGKWTDAATGEHGDLLDVIRESGGFRTFRDVADEARRFLCMPRPDPEPASTRAHAPAEVGSPMAARRL